MKTIGACLVVVAAAGALVAADEPVVGLPCDGCEAVFVGRPEAPASEVRIAPVDEPGEPMRIDGLVRDPAGRPVPGIIVYAYHTNHEGRYPRDLGQLLTAARTHGRLRAWARSDAEGRFAFETIRPAGYPRDGTPAHVHFHVIEPGRCTYYIDDLVFDDDPRLTPALRRQMLTGRGGDGLGKPVKDDQGRWRVRRDIVLGANVPGWPTR